MSAVVYIEKNDIHSTLTTWLYCSMWQLFSAYKQGKIGYINWHSNKGFLESYYDKSRFEETPNAYNWYFIQPCFATEPPKEYAEKWIWEQWADPIPVSLMAQPLWVIKRFFKDNLHFNEETNRRGKLIQDKYNIDFSKTIGLSWRGTDIYLDGRPRIPIELYFPWIDDILEKEPDLRIAATAEEESILDPLLKRYPNAFKIEEFVSSPFQSKHNPERFSNVSGYERGLQPALMVWLFSKCAHYIKNRSSTGAVASWLSDGRIVSISHPENLGYEIMNDQVEIEGIRYPLYR